LVYSRSHWITNVRCILLIGKFFNYCF
jgi:hypothetical protein